jgi:hypothetical protein
MIGLQHTSEVLNLPTSTNVSFSFVFLNLYRAPPIQKKEERLQRSSLFLNFFAEIRHFRRRFAITRESYPEIRIRRKPS